MKNGRSLRPEAGQRRHDLREVFNAALHREDGRTLALPNDLPPWEIVYQQTSRWLKAGVFEAMVPAFVQKISFSRSAWSGRSAGAWSRIRGSVGYARFPAGARHHTRGLDALAGRQAIMKRCCAWCARPRVTASGDAVAVNRGRGPIAIAGIPPRSLRDHASDMAGPVHDDELLVR
jgi:hypothetical protein